MNDASFLKPVDQYQRNIKGTIYKVLSTSIDNLDMSRQAQRPQQNRRMRR